MPLSSPPNSTLAQQRDALAAVVREVYDAMKAAQGFEPQQLEDMMERAGLIKVVAADAGLAAEFHCELGDPVWRQTPLGRAALAE